MSAPASKCVFAVDAVTDTRVSALLRSCCIYPWWPELCSAGGGGGSQGGVHQFFWCWHFHWCCDSKEGYCARFACRASDASQVFLGSEQPGLHARCLLFAPPCGCSGRCTALGCSVFWQWAAAQFGITQGVHGCIWRHSCVQLPRIQGSCLPEYMHNAAYGCVALPVHKRSRQ